MKYTGDISDAIGDIKRLYADLEITSICPQCECSCTRDFNEEYISYGNGTLYFYCENDHEWEIEADITATVIIETKEDL